MPRVLGQLLMLENGSTKPSFRILEVELDLVFNTQNPLGPNTSFLYPHLQDKRVQAVYGRNVYLWAF